MLDLLIQSIPLAIVASTPLLLAVEGELVVQRSGMINLGVEGMMLAAAFGATVAASSTSSIAAGILGGVAAAAIVALIFGVFAIRFGADQIVTGTAINLLVVGATGFAYREMQSRMSPPQMTRDLLTPLGWIAVPIVLALFLWSTTTGLRVRAAGENPEALRATGWSPARYRCENMTAGRGFIALSVVIFGRWSVRGAVAGTALFGIAAALQYALQAANRGIAFHLLLATPYVVTLLILFGVAGRVRAPEALGKSA
jgi:general nucleoside transport system permease protein